MLDGVAAAIVLVTNQYRDCAWPVRLGRLPCVQTGVAAGLRGGTLIASHECAQCTASALANSRFSVEIAETAAAIAAVVDSGRLTSRGK